MNQSNKCDEAEEEKEKEKIKKSNEKRPKRTKYTKHGVKRQHQIIDGILPLLEKISKIDGVKKVNPGRISYSPKRGISQPALKIQRRTITGFKLLAHSKGAVQEIFVIVQDGKTDDVVKELEFKTMLTMLGNQ